MMQATTDGARGPDGLEDAIRTFASRLARRLLLERLCGDGHPVLANENDLVEMASSRLQELMLCHPERARSATRAKVEAAVRRTAAERIARSDEDEDVKQEMLDRLRRVDLAHLFPVLN